MYNNLKNIVHSIIINSNKFANFLILTILIIIYFTLIYLLSEVVGNSIFMTIVIPVIFSSLAFRFYYTLSLTILLMVIGFILRYLLEPTVINQVPTFLAGTSLTILLGFSISMMKKVYINLINQIKIKEDIEIKRNIESKKLLLSETQFRNFFENLPIGAYRTSIDGRIINVNKECMKILGYNSIIEQKSRNLNTEFYEPEYSRKDFIKKLIDNNGTIEITSLWERKNGQSILIKENAWLIYNQSNEPEFIDGTIEDVSITNKLLNDLKESENQYKTIIEQSNIAIINVDIHGNIFYFNNQFLKLFNFDDSRAKELNILNIAHHEDSERISNLHFNIINQIESNIKYEFKGITSDGKILHLLAFSNIIHINNEITGQRIYIWDISDRILKEKLLAESEATFRGLFENALIGIYRLNPDFELELSNPALMQILKFDNFDDLKNDFNSLRLEEQKNNLECYKNQILSHNKITSFESKWKNSQNEILDLRENAWVIKNSENQIEFIDGVIIDLTEFKKNERELKILSGLLPICSSCKKIRDNNGKWQVIEEYIDDNSEAEFSHSICPDCAKILYPNINLD